MQNTLFDAGPVPDGYVFPDITDEDDLIPFCLLQIQKLLDYTGWCRQSPRKGHYIDLHTASTLVVNRYIEAVVMREPGLPYKFRDELAACIAYAYSAGKQNTSMIIINDAYTNEFPVLREALQCAREQYRPELRPYRPRLQVFSAEPMHSHCAYI